MKLAASLLAIAGSLALAGELERRGATATMPCASLAPTDAYLSEGPPRAADAEVNLPAIGRLRAAVLFVDFSDAPGTGRPRRILRTWVRPGARWLRQSSYGRLTVKLVPTSRWIRMPQPAASYGVKCPLSYDPHKKYIADAIAAADATFDFAKIDIVYVVAPQTDLISCSPNFRGAPGTFVADGRKLGAAVTFGRDAYSDGRTVLPHETGHALGLPDLYASGDTHRFVGTWDLMGNLFTPTDYFAWHKYKLGWLNPGQVVCAPAHAMTTATLRPVETRKGKKAVFVRTGDRTGLLVENRQRLRHDRRICKTGALVYTVDSSVPTGSGPVKVIGGTTDGCGSGRLSDAPLRPGESVNVGDVSIRVSTPRGAPTSRNLVVSVTVP